MTNKNKIEEYKMRLESEKEKLLKELAVAEKAPDFGNDIDGGDEEADEAEETANELSIANVIHERLLEVETALNDMASGKFGVCKKCGGEISERMLDLIPKSQLCEACKMGR